MGVGWLNSYLKEQTKGVKRMLIVGIESEKGRQMFSEEENEFLGSLAMGGIAMAAGIGRIADDQYHRSVSVDEATFRFQMTARKVLKDNEDGAPFTQEFVQRMADAGWRANVGLDPFEMWALKHAKVSLNWSSDGFTQRMMRVYENAVDSMNALDRIVGYLADTGKASEIHYLIPDYMYDTDINENGNVLLWDDEREQAYLAPTEEVEA
tara:strand:+ start:1519 stop:2145 length:627 start_codon:yes stop_codon:yes gene_type:complete